MAAAHSPRVDFEPGQQVMNGETILKEGGESITQVPIKLDIEHALVKDDPRKWSNARKYAIVAIISLAATIAGLGGNIYNPSIAQIESQLHASSSEISLSLSLFILIQGSFPLIWTSFSEIYGRKIVYLVSIALCTVGIIVGATSKTIGVLIGMRCLQAAGSSAVIAIGAATLADIYEPAERGTMMGIYYCAPLIGPSLGPIIGGFLTQVFDWRAVFWFLAIFTSLCFVSFIFFKDTFRRERSLTYQTVLRRVLEHEAAKHSETSTIVGAETHEEKHAPDVSKEVGQPDDAAVNSPVNEVEVTSQIDEVAVMDIEAQKTEAEVIPNINEVRLSLKDVNPVGPIIHVLRRMNNLVTLTASGLIFAFSYSISYTCSLTLANKYGYNALETGLVLLSYGVGCLLGSILGGRYSDHVFKQLRDKTENGSRPEMRLESTKLFMLFLPPSVIAYGWVCEQHVNVSAICVMLFLAGFLSICIYSSTLAYIVDANTGRSSSAVATNSCFRGVFAFVASEVAVPLQNALGDGGLYSLWAGLIVLAEALLLLVWWKGGAWREKWDRKEQAHA